MLEEKIMDICQDIYYNDQKVMAFPSICIKDLISKNKIDMSSAALTKSGIGRATTQLVVDIVLNQLKDTTSNEPFTYHPSTCQKIINFSSNLLKRKFHTTVDQVENTIKPLKFEIECSDTEWESGKDRAIKLVEKHIEKAQGELQEIRSQVGRRKLRTAVKYLRHQNKMNLEKNKSMAATTTSSSNDTTTTTTTKSESNPKIISTYDDIDDIPSTTQATTNPNENNSIDDSEKLKKEISKPRQYNPILLEKASEALKLRKEIAILKGRAAALRSRQCITSENKTCCPEAFLSVIAQKLANSAVMFIQIELLNEFMFQFPREVDNKLYYDLTREEINKFACENPTIRRHIELQKRKDALELVMDKLVYLVRRQNELIRRKDNNEL